MDTPFIVKDVPGAVVLSLNSTGSLENTSVSSILGERPASTRIFFTLNVNNIKGELVHDGNRVIRLAGLAPVTINKFPFLS